MRRRWTHYARLLALGLLAAVVAAPVFAQRGVGQGRGKRQQASPPRTEAPRSGENRAPGRGPGNNLNPRRGLREEGIPPQLIERLRNLSPADQERVLNNNRRLQEMPAERREEIRRRLQQWNSLTAQQQRAIREREEIWRNMTFEQRRHVREEIFPVWERLPLDRKQGILRRLRALHDLSESERAARLADERFLTGLNSEDRELLRELSRLRVGPADRGAEEVPPE